MLAFEMAFSRVEVASGRDRWLTLHSEAREVLLSTKSIAGRAWIMTLHTTSIAACKGFTLYRLDLYGLESKHISSNSSHVSEANFSFQERIARAVYFRQNGLLALCLFLKCCNPTLDFVFIAPVADHVVAVTDLVQLSA